MGYETPGPKHRPRTISENQHHINWLDDRNIELEAKAVKSTEMMLRLRCKNGELEAEVARLNSLNNHHVGVIDEDWKSEDELMAENARLKAEVARKNQALDRIALSTRDGD